MMEECFASLSINLSYEFELSKAKYESEHHLAPQKPMDSELDPGESWRFFFIGISSNVWLANPRIFDKPYGIQHVGDAFFTMKNC
jgi:hypothetical protein